MDKSCDTRLFRPLIYSAGGQDKVSTYDGILEIGRYDRVTVYQWGDFVYRDNFRLSDKFCSIEITADDCPIFSEGISLSRCFQGMNVIGDISNWDTSEVIDMSYMFMGCPFNGDLSKWDTSKVRDMRGMFSNSTYKQDISKFDDITVPDMS